MAQFSFLFKAVGLIERDRERAVLVPLPSSSLRSPTLLSSPPRMSRRSNELKRQSAPSSDYFVERERRERERDRKEGSECGMGWAW